MMKSLHSIKGVAAALSLCLLVLFIPVAQAYSPSETLVQVGNRVITGYDLDREMERIKSSFNAQGREPPKGDSLTYMAIDELVKKQLVLAESERVGLKVSDNQLDGALRQIAAQNNIDVRQLPDAIRAQGIDYERYLANLREQVAINQMQERVISRASTVSEEEVDQFLLANPQLETGKVKYSFWLATLPLTETSLDRRTELLEELNGYARAFGDGVMPQSDNIIDVRTGEDVSAANLPPQLANSLSRLKPGEVSAPFRSELGYHVTKLIGEKDDGELLHQNRFSQVIFLKQNYPSEEKIWQTVNTAVAQIESGTAFDIVAARYSDDPEVRQNFGDLGWMVADQFPDSFRQAVLSLKVGEVSKPIETSFSIHIIKITDERDLAQQDAVRENARLQVMAEGQQRAFNEWVNDLKDNAYILVLNPDIGDIYP